MRVVDFKFLLPLVLALVVGTFIVGLNLEDATDIALQTSAVAVSAYAYNELPSAALPQTTARLRSHRRVNSVLPSSIAVRDLTCVLRC